MVWAVIAEALQFQVAQCAGLQNQGDLRDWETAGTYRYAGLSSGSLSGIVEVAALLVRR